MGLLHLTDIIFYMFEKIVDYISNFLGDYFINFSVTSPDYIWEFKISNCWAIFIFLVLYFLWQKK